MNLERISRGQVRLLVSVCVEKLEATSEIRGQDELRVRTNASVRRGDAHLTRLGVNSLIICGESTSGCVRASVVDAYSYGYHVTIAEECVFDRSAISHKVNLFDLHHKYADVMVLDEIIAHLENAFPSTQAAE